MFLDLCVTVGNKINTLMMSRIQIDRGDHASAQGLPRVRVMELIRPIPNNCFTCLSSHVSSMCSQETAPVTFQACVITKDCVLSEWSEWAACSKDCYDPNGPKGQRTRSRRVSQFPVAGGTACPQLEETEPCSPQGDGVSPCIMYVQEGKSDISEVNNVTELLPLISVS